MYKQHSSYYQRNTYNTYLSSSINIILNISINYFNFLTNRSQEDTYYSNDHHLLNTCNNPLSRFGLSCLSLLLPFHHQPSGMPPFPHIHQIADQIPFDLLLFEKLTLVLFQPNELHRNRIYILHQSASFDYQLFWYFQHLAAII